MHFVFILGSHPMYKYISQYLYANMIKTPTRTETIPTSNSPGQGDAQSVLSSPGNTVFVSLLLNW